MTPRHASTASWAAWRRSTLHGAASASRIRATPIHSERSSSAASAPLRSKRPVSRTRALNCGASSWFRSTSQTGLTGAGAASVMPSTSPCCPRMGSASRPAAAAASTASRSACRSRTRLTSGAGVRSTIRTSRGAGTPTGRPSLACISMVGASPTCQPEGSAGSSKSSGGAATCPASSSASSPISIAMRCSSVSSSSGTPRAGAASASIRRWLAATARCISSARSTPSASICSVTEAICCASRTGAFAG